MNELTEEQKRSNMRKYWKAKLSLDYYSKGLSPDTQIINEIKNRGLDYENMWDALTKRSACTKYIKEELLTEIPSDLSKSLTKWITINKFQLVAEDWEDCLNDVLHEFNFIYNSLIKKKAINQISENELNSLKVLEQILTKSINTDVAKVKAELEKEVENKGVLEEKERQRLAEEIIRLKQEKEKLKRQQELSRKQKEEEEKAKRETEELKRQEELRRKQREELKIARKQKRENNGSGFKHVCIWVSLSLISLVLGIWAITSIVPESNSDIKHVAAIYARVIVSTGEYNELDKDTFEDPVYMRTVSNIAKILNYDASAFAKSVKKELYDINSMDGEELKEYFFKHYNKIKDPEALELCTDIMEILQNHGLL